MDGNDFIHGAGYDVADQETRILQGLDIPHAIS